MNWKYVGDDIWENFDTKERLSSYQLCHMWKSTTHTLVGNLAVIEHHIKNGHLIDALQICRKNIDYILNAIEHEKWVREIEKPE